MTDYDANGNEIIDAEVIEHDDDAVEELSPLHAEVAYHLQNKFDKTIPLSMLDPCVTAINKANEGEWYAEIDLNGNKYKGESKASVETIINSHALQQWVKDPDNLITISDPEGNIVWKGYGDTLTLADGKIQEGEAVIDDDKR
jgi:hypothetical protein